MQKIASTVETVWCQNQEQAQWLSQVSQDPAAQSWGCGFPLWPSVALSVNVGHKNIPTTGGSEDWGKPSGPGVCHQETMGRCEHCGAVRCQSGPRPTDCTTVPLPEADALRKGFPIARGAMRTLGNLSALRWEGFTSCSWNSCPEGGDR